MKGGRGRKLMMMKRSTWKSHHIHVDVDTTTSSSVIVHDVEIVVVRVVMSGGCQIGVTGKEISDG